MKSKLNDTALFITILLLVTVLVTSCTNPPATVRMNLFDDASVIPIIYGNSVGYFEDEGINLQFGTVKPGVQINEDVVNGTLDIGFMSSYAYVVGLMEGSNLQILTIYATSYSAYYLLTHSDSQITHPKHLEGKSIGISGYNQGALFFDSLSTYYNLDMNTMDTVLLKGTEWIPDFLEGRLDAVIAVQPTVSQLLNTEGNKVKRIPLDNFQRSNMLFVAAPEYIQNNPDTIIRFLSAVKKADRDLYNQDKKISEQLEIVSGIPPNAMAMFLNAVNFELVLDQQLLTTMEGQLNWLSRQRNTQTDSSINFLEHLYFDALEEVNPEGITIINR